MEFVIPSLLEVIRDLIERRHCIYSLRLTRLVSKKKEDGTRGSALFHL
jgi:hypothetical protein